MNLGRIFARDEILERLRKTIHEGKPIIGAGCSTGLIAKCAELGGADLIIVYSTGLSRHMGLPTSLLGDSNGTTLSMYKEIANVVADTPIIAGVESYDPRTLDLKMLVKQFVETGFSGIINFPTMGMYGDRKCRWRVERESVGLGWSREVKMMRTAHEMNIFTMTYVYDSEDTRDMAEIPVDVMVPHAGGTAGGLTGFKASFHYEGAQIIREMSNVAKAVNPNIICLAHGGAFATPDDTTYLYEHTDALGFVGASSIERIPIEKAVVEFIREFKSIPTKKKQIH